ncbi:MAG: YtxH domain-containing protein [Lactobacillales bacterium]|jgi:gas vesicle protein|nr:YtxH domain-containing protein [Lactobacillales bacterium]
MRFLKGLIFGSLVGGVIGLFTAKKPGKELREEMAAFGGFRESIAEFNEAKTRLAQEVTTTKQTAQEIKRDIDEYKFSLEARLDVINKQIDKIKSNFS